MTTDDITLEMKNIIRAFFHQESTGEFMAAEQIVQMTEIENCEEVRYHLDKLIDAKLINTSKRYDVRSPLLYHLTPEGRAYYMEKLRN